MLRWRETNGKLVGTNISMIPNTKTQKLDCFHVFNKASD